MKITVLEQETLSAMYCKIYGVEMDAGELAKVPENPTEDEIRILKDVARLWEVRGVKDKLALIAKLLKEVSPSTRCRRAYEMVVNGCDPTTRAIMALNAGCVNVENYEAVLREMAQQEADDEAAREAGLSADEYAELMLAGQSAEEYEDGRRREIIEEGKSYYADKQDDYDRAARFAAEGNTAYYCRLYEITHGRELTPEEFAEDREREALDQDLPLNSEVYADFARVEAGIEQTLLWSYAERYGNLSDEFFYHLGQYAIESAGYISAERGEDQRAEALERERLAARA